MDLKPLIKLCLETQVELNNVIDKDWMTSVHNWQLAAKAELIELLDHLGEIKWWKHQEPNPQEAFIELVDILHFVVSDLLIYPKVNNLVFDTLSYYCTAPTIPKHPKHLVNDQISLKHCFNILKYLNRTPEELFKAYLAKDVLNLFRQANGYKAGTYIKVWEDGEDNTYLEDIINRADFSNPNVKKWIYSSLEEKYKMYSGVGEG